MSSLKYQWEQKDCGLSKIKGLKRQCRHQKSISKGEKTEIKKQEIRKILYKNEANQPKSGVYSLKNVHQKKQWKRHRYPSSNDYKVLQPLINSEYLDQDEQNYDIDYSIYDDHYDDFHSIQDQSQDDHLDNPAYLRWLDQNQRFEDYYDDYDYDNYYSYSGSFGRYYESNSSSSYNVRYCDKYCGYCGRCSFDGQIFTPGW